MGVIPWLLPRIQGLVMILCCLYQDPCIFANPDRSGVNELKHQNNYYYTISSHSHMCPPSVGKFQEALKGMATRINMTNKIQLESKRSEVNIGMNIKFHLDHAAQ